MDNQQVMTTDTLESLTVEREALQEKIRSQIFPCPGCGKNIRWMKWDIEKGGECIHCHGWIEAHEMNTFVEASRNSWYSLCDLSERISVCVKRRHLEELSKGLITWEKFLYSGLQRKDFSIPLYRMLTATFNHWAFHSQDTFYQAHFETLELQIETLESMMALPIDGAQRYGEEVERKILAILEETDALSKLRVRHAQEVETKERAELARLKGKYEPPIVVSCNWCKYIDGYRSTNPLCPAHGRDANSVK